MPVYRVKQGKFHGPRNEYGPGDLVEHTEYEASGFLDKLELVDEELVVKPEDQALAAESPAEEALVAKVPVVKSKASRKRAS